MKLRGPWSALEIVGIARSESAQVRAANFSLGSFSLRAPFNWARGQLAVQNGRIDAKKFSLAGGKLRYGVAQVEIGAISYDPKKPGVVKAQIKLSGGQFSSVDSSEVGEDLAVEGSVEISVPKPESDLGAGPVNLTAGELLWGKFFGELKAQKPALLIDAEYDRDSIAYSATAAITLATVGQMNLTGSIDRFRRPRSCGCRRVATIFRRRVFSNTSCARLTIGSIRSSTNSQWADRWRLQLQFDGAPEQLAGAATYL